ncbi:MAG: ABC transporter ATP-binding protein [Chromatiales bacterium]
MDQPAESQSAIQALNLTKSYGQHQAVAGLTFNIRKGEFFGLLGRNGSGKTTTLHMLSTLVRPSAGAARVAGHDVLREAVTVRRHIGLVFQESALDRSLSAEENLRFAGALHDLPGPVIRERTDELLRLFGLWERRHAPVATLSGGMRRALDIARGVLHRPQVLFLDEPTIGLDVINRRAIWRFLERLRGEHGITIVLTTHYLEEAADCDRVTFMRNGRFIGSGRPQDLITSLGAFILDIDSDAPATHAEQLQPVLGEAIIEGSHVQFRVQDERANVVNLQRDLQSDVRALSLRRPDLNDVYIWLNRTADMEQAA